MARHRFITRVAFICFAACLLQPARGDDKSEKYAERQIFDPATGEWKAVAPPIAGTEDGDLELARSLLARSEFEAARKAFKAWFKSYPDSARRPEALFYAADTEVSSEEAKADSGDLMQAYRWYEELLEGWAGTELADRAIRREIIIAEMFLFKGKKQRVMKGMFRVSATDEALTMLDRIANEWAPNTALAEQALRLKADYHYDAGEFEEAEEAYSRLNREFGRGKYRRFALLRSGESALARFPGVKFDDADLLEAEVYFTDFEAKYPTYAAEADVASRLERIKDSKAEKTYLVGQYYERTKKTSAALFYYRYVAATWPGTSWAVQANERIAKLGDSVPAPVIIPSSAPLNAPAPVEQPPDGFEAAPENAPPPADPIAPSETTTPPPPASATPAQPIDTASEPAQRPDLLPMTEGPATSGNNPAPPPAQSPAPASTPAPQPPPSPATPPTNPPPEPLEELPPRK